MIRMDVADPERAESIKHVVVGKPHESPGGVTLQQLKERVKAGEGSPGAKRRFNQLQKNLRGHRTMVMKPEQVQTVLRGELPVLNEESVLVETVLSKDLGSTSWI